MAVEVLQRLKRAAFETVLAVVIVLDDQHVALACPVQQLQTAIETERHTQRKLVRRCHVDQANIFRQKIDAQAFGIDRHANDLGTGIEKALARRHIARLFHGHAAARFQHHLRQQVQRLLCALGDQQVFPGTADCAADRQIARDSLAQRWIASGVVIEA